MIAAENLAPWCNLGSVVFRAGEVSDGGDEIRVSARVRSDEVAHALETFTPEQTAHGSEAPFTWAGRSKFVRVASMKLTTTSARSKTFRSRSKPASSSGIASSRCRFLDTRRTT